MNNQKLSDYMKNKILILDGASGTQMQRRGMPAGVCPDLFAIENPEMLASFQREYYESGSDIVYSFTFGGNYPKLKHYGIDISRVEEINEKVVKISCDVRDEMRLKYPDRNFYVAGDLAPTGEFLEPAGMLTFKQLIEIYKQQVTGLLNAGVDLFVVETMMDLNQTRAAVIAIKEICDLPIFTTLTFDHGRTLSGERPLECLITLEALGVTAFGANCSTGPQEMAELLSGIPEYSNKPIIAKPNAGMPQQINGETVFPMDADDFADAAIVFLNENITVLGGCCGTTPEHIKKLSERVMKNTDDIKVNCDSKLSKGPKAKDMICSSQNSIEISKINPADETMIVTCQDPADLADEISDIVSRIVQGDAEYAVVDFIEYENSTNFSEDELREGILNLGMFTKTPVVIKSLKAETINTFAKSFCGRAGIADNSEFDEKAIEVINLFGICRI